MKLPGLPPASRQGRLGDPGARPGPVTGMTVTQALTRIEAGTGWPRQSHHAATSDGSVPAGAGADRNNRDRRAAADRRRVRRRSRSVTPTALSHGTVAVNSVSELDDFASGDSGLTVTVTVTAPAVHSLTPGPLFRVLT